MHTPRNLLLANALAVATACICHAEAGVSFREEPGRIAVLIDGKAIATYVYADAHIPRPYFAHVRTRGGIQVTRNHPPKPGADATDHEALHPGLWMAFGNLNGFDFWRNKARIAHDGFQAAPKGGPRRGEFAVRNRYRAEAAGGETVCHEIARYTLVVRPAGYLLVWDSSFSSDRPFWFGDQEEMGLGLRVATPLTVQAGGTILDATGRRNEAQIWGKSADWCDYSGVIDGRRVGITLMCGPANFRPSRYHARDYGFVAANPFGQRSFNQPDESRVTVKTGERLRLQYGLLIHESPEDRPPDLASEFEFFRTRLADETATKPAASPQ